MAHARTPWWAWAWPLVAWAVFLLSLFVRSSVVDAAAGVALIATVFAAVYHAEVVAHRVGEPFGTLVLAVAVTVIEVALIVSVMICGAGRKGGAGARHGLRRRHDRVQRHRRPLPALGGARHHEQGFQLQGASAALAVLVALAALTLVLPNFATSAPGPLYSTSQLVFAGDRIAGALRLVRFRADRAPSRLLPRRSTASEEAHAPPPSNKTALVSLALLLVALVAVVGLAKSLTPTLEAGDRPARRAEGGRRHHHRGAGAAARRPGGGARRAAQPVADEPQPGAGLGAGDHRPDHPGGRRCLDRARHSRSSSASTRRTWSCWR